MSILSPPRTNIVKNITPTQNKLVSKDFSSVRASRINFRNNTRMKGSMASTIMPATMRGGNSLSAFDAIENIYWIFAAELFNAPTNTCNLLLRKVVHALFTHFHYILFFSQAVNRNMKLQFQTFHFIVERLLRHHHFFSPQYWPLIGLIKGKYGYGQHFWLKNTLQKCNRSEGNWCTAEKCKKNLASCKLARFFGCGPKKIPYNI